MNRYDYQIIQGEEITKNELVLPRAIELARVSTNNRSRVLDCYFKKGVDCEILLLRLDIEAPSLSKNGIQEHEDVAIICRTSDANFPEVYALRKDFFLGLPHTNAKEEDYPVSLCVTDQNYLEIKHVFNPIDFINRIRGWFARTAEGTLHLPDQPLELFCFPDKMIYLSNKEMNEGLDWVSVEEKGNNRQIIKKAISNKADYFLLNKKFICDYQVSGFIFKNPKVLDDLDSILEIGGRPISECILTSLKNSNPQKFKDKKIMIICNIPMKRNITDQSVEGSYRYVLTFRNNFNKNSTSKSLYKLGDIMKFGKNDELSLLKNEAISFSMLFIQSGRDEFAAYNNEILNNEVFTLVGCGTLGSQILDQMVRSSYGKEWNIYDHDYLLPHNIARHVLDADDIMEKKVTALERKYEFLFEKPIISAHDIDVLKINDENEFVNCKAIIDASTSIAVERKLALDINNVKSRRITTFLNPKGTDLIILAEDNERKFRLDLLEMDYYRTVLNNDNLKNHLELPENIYYNNYGCRNITSKINGSNINLLASICVKEIKRIDAQNLQSASIWRIDDDDYSVSKENIQTNEWQEYVRKDGYKIYLNNALIDEIRLKRNEKISCESPVETGGLLIGSFDNTRNIIYLVDMIPAPIDSEEKSCSLIRGIEDLKEKYNNMTRRVANQIFYLGEWHSHLNGVSVSPSDLDRKMYEEMKDLLWDEGKPFVMMIVGKNDVCFPS